MSAPIPRPGPPPNRPVPGPPPAGGPARATGVGSPAGAGDPDGSAGVGNPVDLAGAGGPVGQHGAVGTVAAVRASVADLDRLDDLPVADHVGRYDTLHGTLSEALAAIDGV